MERGILMVPNGQEEKLAAKSKRRQLLSLIWEQMGRTASGSVTVVPHTFVFCNSTICWKVGSQHIFSLQTCTSAMSAALSSVVKLAITLSTQS